MNAVGRAAARARVEAVPPMPWAYYNETVWFSTAEALAARDANPEAFDDNDWPTGFDSDLDRPMGEFIAHARADLPAALDAIDRVLALHQESDIGDGVKFCSYDHGDATPETWPCDIILAIECAS